VGAGIAAAIAFVLASVACGTVRGGHVPVVMAELRDFRDSVANLAGFRITSIALAGRHLEVDLRSAVDTRGTIGQAIGILIERHKILPQQAFQLLVKASQRRHMKLRDLALYVIETGIDPSAV